MKNTPFSTHSKSKLGFFLFFITITLIGCETHLLVVESGSGGGMYATGAEVPIEAAPSPSGKVFDRWIVNSGTAKIQNISDPTTTLTMPAEPVTITATYIDASGENPDDDPDDEPSDDPVNDAPSGHLSDYLLTGEVLEKDQWLLSDNGQYKFKLMTNGNLVLRDTQTQESIWKSNTANESVSHLILQADGNLVLRSTSNSKLWSTQTAGSNASILILDNDGALALYDDDDKAVWSLNISDTDPDPNPDPDPDALTTAYDGGILVPERRRFKLFIFKGGTSSSERNWNDSDNVLWSMNLKNASGVASSDMNTYNNLWRGDNSLNDAKRVIHNGKIHIIVTGNGGNAVAMYEFKSKKCVYWSKTSCSSPHDVEYLPKGSGYLVVAHASGAQSYLELYDISKNNKGRISGSEVSHSGVHSVHWDAEQDRLWAWGGGNDRLKSYKVVFSNGKPTLKRDNNAYKVTVSDFEVGTGHGGAPMMVNDKRCLILAGKGGILQFNTETHSWKILQKATQSQYSNPKGLSYNPKTGEIITTKSQDKVYSVKSGVGARQVNNSEIYKARWWFHNSFSYSNEER